MSAEVASEAVIESRVERAGRASSEIARGPATSS